jgi:hypothetical protein
METDLIRRIVEEGNPKLSAAAACKDYRRGGVMGSGVCTAIFGTKCQPASSAHPRKWSVLSQNGLEADRTSADALKV